MSFRLKPVPPFRLDLTAWALRRRPANIVDRWDGTSYRRVLLLENRPVEVEVSQSGNFARPILLVTATIEGPRPPARSLVAAALERMLGLRRDLSGFYELAAKEAGIKELASRFQGLKPPRFPTIFEALANAIACQQLSLTVGIIVLNRLAQNFGAVFRRAEGPVYSFALPEKLAGARVQELRQMGFSSQKSLYLIDLAQAAAVRGPDLNGWEELDDETALTRLLEFRGVGRWTGEYTLLRGLGRIAVFPGDDVGARNKLERLLHSKDLNYDKIRRITRRWHPYGGLIYFHLLLDGLLAEGKLEVA